MAKAVGQRLLAASLASRSEAYHWLRKNHAEIAEAFRKQVRPSWKALQATALEAGLDFSAHALRRSWVRLERDLAREAGRSTKPVSRSVPPPVIPPTTKEATNPNVRNPGTSRLFHDNKPFSAEDKEKWRKADK